MRTNKPLKTEKTLPVEVTGSFTCQTCDEPVDEAEYYVQQKLLVWQCEQGHVTRLEDFKL